jgi:hypothetical protein
MMGKHIEAAITTVMPYQVGCEKLGVIPYAMSTAAHVRDEKILLTGGGDNRGCSFSSAHMSLGTSIIAIVVIAARGED